MVMIWIVHCLLSIRRNHVSHLYWIFGRYVSGKAEDIRKSTLDQEKHVVAAGRWLNLNAAGVPKITHDYMLISCFRLKSLCQFFNLKLYSGSSGYDFFILFWHFRDILFSSALNSPFLFLFIDSSACLKSSYFTECGCLNSIAWKILM